MRNYVLDNKYLYYSRSITDGTQDKYFRNGYFYKVNKLGNEGFVEYLVSLVLKNSTLPKSLYASYEYCFINDKYGCRCKSFLNENEMFVSINHLYKNLTGKSILDVLWSKGSEIERLNFILDVANLVSVSTFRSYLQALVQLDMLILNVDRHVSNYGFIYNLDTKVYKPAKIFDNGLSLDTKRCGDKASCTLGGSFEGQVVAFGYPVQPIFRINYKSLLRELDSVKRLYGDYYELGVLKSQLIKYKSLFNIG